MHAIFIVQFRFFGIAIRVNHSIIVIVESGGVGFTPHVITVKAGEVRIFACFMFL